MIKVGNDYRIKSYTRGYKVYRDVHRQDKDGNDVLVFLGYTTGIEHSLSLIQGDMERKLVDQQDMTLEESIEKFREIHEELKGLIPEIKKVPPDEIENEGMR